jgi:protein-histidine pros-kinase
VQRGRFAKHAEVRRTVAALELVALHKDGGEFPIEVSLSPLRRSDGLLICAVIRDVTARKRATAEIQEERKKLEAASRAKSDFLASMSHELRTPLNAVIGFAQMLELDLPHNLTPTQMEYADYILRGGRHLLNLVDEVLDLAGIEAGRLRLSIESLCVQDVLADVAASMSPIARKEGLSFEIVSPPEVGNVLADNLRLQQVLMNLVSNAIKYNRPEGAVKLTVRSLPGGSIGLPARPVPAASSGSTCRAPPPITPASLCHR